MSRALLLLVLVLAPAALAGSAADPGVSGDSILIGGTAPLSGEASSAAAVSRGADAYFKYVNARGGVNGRQIEYNRDGCDVRSARGKAEEQRWDWATRRGTFTAHR